LFPEHYKISEENPPAWNVTDVADTADVADAADTVDMAGMSDAVDVADMVVAVDMADGGWAWGY
jgi:hypothetical protein